MPGISQLRRGRGLLVRAKRRRLRARQPRFSSKKLRSDFSAPPRRSGREQPYLSTGVDIADLL